MKVAGWLRVLGSLALTSVLSACAALDGAVDSRVVNLNRAVDSSRNENILLNIVRASQSQPLNFTQISKLTDDGSLSLNSGLPTITFGPHAVSNPRTYAFTNSLTTNVSTSFDLAVLETTDFYGGLLKPIELSAINLLQKQGYELDLLFSVLVDAVRVKDPNRRLTWEFRNDPSADLKAQPPCPETDFKVLAACNNFIEDAARNSACVSPYNPANPQFERNIEGCHYHAFQYLAWEALRAGVSTETRQIYVKTSKDDQKLTTDAHICFDPALAVSKGARERWVKRQESSDLNVCDGQWLRDTADDAARKKEADLARKVGGPEGTPFRIYYPKSDGHIESETFTGSFTTRSTFGVFRYLGSLLRSGLARTIRPDPSSQEVLLNVDVGDGGPCFVETIVDERYCVPKTNSVTTKEVFNLLSQLIALNVKPGDLPYTPTVRVAP